MAGSFESATAKAYFVTLVARAADLRRQIAAQEAQARNPIGGSVVDVGIGALIPYGLRGTARRFVGRAASSARQQRKEAAQQSAGGLVNEARSFATQYAVVPATPAVPPRPASAAKLLGATLDTGSAESRLLKLEQALRRLTSLPLIENSRIAEYRRQLEYEKARVRVRRLEPSLTDLLATFSPGTTATAPEARLGPFMGFPPVREPLEGALRSLGRETPEDYRQGLNSLRVALDALIEAVTGKGDWKEGVSVLVSVDEERRIVVAAHHYLSRASHHGTHFDRASLALGVDLFISVGSRLVELARLVRSKT